MFGEDLPKGPSEVQAYAAGIVARELIRFPPGERRAVLRALLLSASSGLRIVLGHRNAAEDVYALADQIVAETGSGRL